MGTDKARMRPKSSQQAEEKPAVPKGGRLYTPDEMIAIFEKMKRDNVVVKPDIDLQNELFHSVRANQPAMLEGGDLHGRVSSKQSYSSIRNRGGNVLPIDSLTAATSAWSPFASNARASPAAAPIMMVAPIHMEWMYKDSSGVEQGPFTGTMMQEWYAGNWLQDSLPIRRAEEREYYSISDFVKKVGNYIEPFLVPLPPVSKARTAPLLLSPEQTNWIYRDPTGAEQGPFDGIRMQEWFSMEWLKPDLMIRRIEETQYYSLMNYMQRIDNFVEPFLVPQPVILGAGLVGGASLGGYFEDTQARIQQQLAMRQRELELLQLQVREQQQQQQRQSEVGLPVSPVDSWDSEGRIPRAVSEIEPAQSAPSEAMVKPETEKIEQDLPKTDVADTKIADPSLNAWTAKPSEMGDVNALKGTEKKQSEPKESKEPKEPKDLKESKELNKLKEPKEPKELKELQELPKTQKSQKTVQSKEQSKEPKSSVRSWAKIGEVMQPHTEQGTAGQQEVVAWAYGALRGSLHAGINAAELLTMLFSLPVGSGESREIIAETVYASSATMDGRRFADEFAKRRMQAGSGGGEEFQEKLTKMIQKVVNDEGADVISAGGRGRGGRGRGNGALGQSVVDSSQGEATFTPVVGKQRKSRK